MDRVRIDKWIWAARFAKTRSAATELVLAGHVKVGGERVKPAREIRGEEVESASATRRTVVSPACRPAWLGDRRRDARRGDGATLQQRERPLGVASPSRSARIPRAADERGRRRLNALRKRHRHRLSRPNREGSMDSHASSYLTASTSERMAEMASKHRGKRAARGAERDRDEDLPRPEGIDRRQDRLL